MYTLGECRNCKPSGTHQYANKRGKCSHSPLEETILPCQLSILGVHHSSVNINYVAVIRFTFPWTFERGLHDLRLNQAFLLWQQELFPENTVSIFILMVVASTSKGLKERAMRRIESHCLVHTASFKAHRDMREVLKAAFLSTGRKEFPPTAIREPLICPARKQATAGLSRTQAFQSRKLSVLASFSAAAAGPSAAGIFSCCQEIIRTQIFSFLNLLIWIWLLCEACQFPS